MQPIIYKAFTFLTLTFYQFILLYQLKFVLKEKSKIFILYICIYIHVINYILLNLKKLNRVVWKIC